MQRGQPRPQQVPGRLLRHTTESRSQHGPRVGAAVEPVHQVVGPGIGQTRDLVVGHRLALELGQQRLGFDGAALLEIRLDDQQPGSHPTAGVASRAGQPFGQRRVEPLLGLAGRFQQQVGVAGHARVELPGADLQGVLPATGAGVPHRPGQSPAHAAAGDGAHPPPHQFAVQRVGQPGLLPVSFRKQLQQTAFLDGSDRGRAGQRHELADAQRVGHSQVLHGPAAGLVEAFQPRLDQLQQARRGHDVGGQPPHPFLQKERVGPH